MPGSGYFADTALGIPGGRRAGVVGQIVVFNLFAKSLAAPRNQIQLCHDLVGCLRFTRIFGNAKLPLQPKPFHRSRLVGGRESAALFTTFDRTQSRPPCCGPLTKRREALRRDLISMNLCYCHLTHFIYPVPRSMGKNGLVPGPACIYVYNLNEGGWSHLP